LSSDWRPEARRNLVELRGGNAGWSYQRHGTPSVEPTSLACWALLATPIDDLTSSPIAINRNAADWISAIQRADGSVPVAAGSRMPGWSTPYALLLWSRLGGYAPARLLARDWLLRDSPHARRAQSDADRIVGHDQSLVGWPWVEGTHPWIEPTAMAILALCLDGQQEHPRVVEGVRLIVDRALDHGGWNCGNKAIFGRELRALPGPTGLARMGCTRASGSPCMPASSRRLAGRSLRIVSCQARGHHEPSPAVAGLSFGRRHLHRSTNWLGALIMTRRSLLTGLGASVAAGLGAQRLCDWDEWSCRSHVFIASCHSYEADLEAVMRAGLVELGLGPNWVKGKSVLLKPNLVEASGGSPQINTHPAVVRAAAGVFRSWGAREVLVAEGAGHCRDGQLVVDESGMGAMLREAKLEFVDLNYDEIDFVENRQNLTSLEQLALPATLRRADLVVSLPKMKTHHWVGVTLSMKNLFGVMPGIYYGWPKNVLHYAGIVPSILDIAAAVRPHLAIVDGIIGMEGDGPVMGTPRHSGVLAIGTNLPAVDATCARLMKINPWRVGYLVAASGRLGPISERHIEQRGESINSVAQPFQLLDHPYIANLRT
jgi:uncharacterized protein (DUF362 family)